ncbi:MAG: MscL family protein [Candidatus Dojkabacteria bacterium]|uniref:Large-conductance mechanosensitive channel n=2 Tax=Candidatus Dojkabacteria TaxID=74243 RepID=A0A136KFS3_9BACT|nr:MAG: Large-conductance mechanosensitive channel [candidate division WS6 bacterium OLB21]MBW7953344.1 MscL family protein [Candidatus Dojkabacteria bacterium]WKZ27550.1 MAG: MscL family protein [Candidatus Dojkabacteria bacterium]
MKGFLDFIREQGVVGLAVGFILGGAVSGLVKALVDDIINPLLGIILGKAESLTTLVITIAEAEVKVGNFLGVFINFVVIAAVVYFGVKGLKLDQIDKKKDTQDKAKENKKKK